MKPTLIILLAAILAQGGVAFSQSQPSQPVTPPAQPVRPPTAPVTPPNATVNRTAPGVAPVPRRPLPGTRAVPAIPATPGVAPAIPALPPFQTNVVLPPGFTNRFPQPFVTNFPPVRPGLRSARDPFLPAGSLPNPGTVVLPPGGGLTNLPLGGLAVTNVNTRFSFTNGFSTNGLIALSPTLRQQIARLATDLNNLRGPATSLAFRQNLHRTLLAASQGPIRPSDASLARLVNDLTASWSNVAMAPQNQTILARNLALLLNAYAMSPAQTELLLGHTSSLLQTGGIPPQSVGLISSDLAAIASELQQGFAAGAPSPAGTLQVPQTGERENTTPGLPEREPLPVAPQERPVP